ARTAHAAHTIGAWLQPFAARLRPEMAALDQALATLGLDHTRGAVTTLDPSQDARFATLEGFIRDQLCTPSGGFRQDERLVIFTEYKTTLDYLERRLRARYPEDGVIRVLYGGPDMSQGKRDAIKTAFNGSSSPTQSVRSRLSS